MNRIGIFQGMEKRTKGKGLDVMKLYIEYGNPNGVTICVLPQHNQIVAFNRAKRLSFNIPVKFVSKHAQSYNLYWGKVYKLVPIAN